MFQVITRGGNPKSQFNFHEKVTEKDSYKLKIKTQILTTLNKLFNIQRKINYA